MFTVIEVHSVGMNIGLPVYVISLLPVTVRYALLEALAVKTYAIFSPTAQ